MVFTRHEEDRVASGAKLAVLLHGVNLVDLPLDGRRRHGGIEHKHIRAEVWLAGGCQRHAGKTCQEQRKDR